MIKQIINKYFYIDFGVLPRYLNDKIGFELLSTSLLDDLADEMRAKKGYDSIYAAGEEGWYTFTVWVGDEVSLEFEVENSDHEEEIYKIELTPEEQTIIYECLDSQCREFNNKPLMH